MSADNEKTIHGYMAEFSTVDSLLAACRRIRDAGYTKTDAFTPFPVHGVDEALGIRPTALPWITLSGGLLGAAIAISMQIWMNGINYPYIISGKPFISLPAFVPVSFELTILLASFGSFFGMLALNRLPRFSNPMFTNSRFDAATDDKFFLFIGSDDPRYDREGVPRLLGDLGAGSVDPVVDDDSSEHLPKIFIGIVATALLLATIPPLVLARMRVTTSQNPRYHVFYDMDFSPAKDAQQTTTLFADGRAMRLDVPGTYARMPDGSGVEFQSGIDLDALAKVDPARAQRLIRFNGQQPDDEPGDSQPPAITEEDPEPAEQAEPPAEEPPAEEPPAEEPPAEESPAEQPAADEAAAEVAQEAAPAGAVAAPAGAEAAPAGAVVDNTPWLKENPLELSRETLELGQSRFNIYCAVCHGQDGRGNGLVALRARSILASSWVPPSSLHQPTMYADQYPDGKLFNTITHGIRKMPGYASQITPRDRWAVVAYVRALQLSQNAPESLVPAEALPAVAATESR